MKHLLLWSIRLYWITVPLSKRRRCIFHTSCSTYVFEKTQTEGLKSGLSALLFRVRNCRKGFDVFTDPITGSKKMILSTGTVVSEDQIADWLK